MEKNVSKFKALIRSELLRLGTSVTYVIQTIIIIIPANMFREKIDITYLIVYYIFDYYLYW